MKLIIASLVLLTICSCSNSDTDSEEKYQNCLNEKTYNRGIFFPKETDIPNEIKSISIFDSIKQFENHLFKKGLLSGVNNKGYLELINEIENTDFLRKEYEEFNSKHPFIEYNLMNSLFHAELFYDCVKRAFKNQPKYDFILRTKDDVELNSYPNKEILTELINSVDFQSETQRLIVTYLIYSNLYWKYEMK